MLPIHHLHVPLLPYSPTHSSSDTNTPPNLKTPLDRLPSLVSHRTGRLYYQIYTDLHVISILPTCSGAWSFINFNQSLNPIRLDLSVTSHTINTPCASLMDMGVILLYLSWPAVSHIYTLYTIYL